MDGEKTFRLCNQFEKCLHMIFFVLRHECNCPLAVEFAGLGPSFFDKIGWASRLYEHRVIEPVHRPRL